MSGGAGETSAWIDGAPVAWDQAVAKAARLIAAASCPVVGHLGTDVEGARAAVWLAESAGAVLDHSASAQLLADLDPLRESGGFQTTPLEASVRADTVLVVGAADADWIARPARPQGKEVERRVIRADPLTIGEGADRLAVIATLRARVKKRPVAAFAPNLDPVAEVLLAAQFGVVVWSAAELEPLAIEALHGLVRDLNETTRFSTLALAAPDNGAGVQQAMGWMTGFPLRTSFARGAPQHDPWRYDARRLMASGEADCLIWVSSFAGGAAAPLGVTIAIGDSGAASPRVRFAVADPSAQGDAVLFEPAVGAFVAHARPAGAAPSVAATLGAIRAAMGSAPC